jgi:hypothetical protein
VATQGALLAATPEVQRRTRAALARVLQHPQLRCLLTQPQLLDQSCILAAIIHQQQLEGAAAQRRRSTAREL